MNKPTQSLSKRAIAKLIASIALTAFAVAMPVTASAAGFSDYGTNKTYSSYGSYGYWSTSVSWGGCSACGK